MHLAIVGASAVGGALGARLVAAGHDVAFCVRTPIETLTIEAPDGTLAIRPRCVDRIEDADAVLIAVKTQDVAAALSRVHVDAPVACLTNGLEAERICARRFADVHAVCVYTPAEHLEPGVVRQWTAAPRGVLDVGRFPDGVTAIDRQLADAFASAGYTAEPRADVLAQKRAKLLLNLGNIVEALGLDPALATAARDEATRVFAAASLPIADDSARRALVRSEPIAGATRRGGSTWQSLQRGRPLETPYLNGEIVRLGRLHGVPTPINSQLVGYSGSANGGAGRAIK